MIGLAPKHSIYFGRGRSIIKPKSKIDDIYLKDSHRKTHMLAIGTTQIGKSYIIANMATQDILKGDSVVVIDPKGDNLLFSQIVQAAFATNRQDELIYISPIYPDLSAKINPHSHYYMPEELVSHVVSGIQTKDEYFLNIANEITLVIVLSLLLFARNGADNLSINFDTIKQKCSYGSMQSLRTALRNINTEEAIEVVRLISHILETPEDHFAKVSSTLRTVLTKLSTGSVGQIIGKARTNKFIDRLEAGKRVILYVQTGSMLTRETAHVVGRVLVSMIQSFVGRQAASNKMITPSLSIYMDEFSNIVYKSIADMFNKSASVGVRLHALTQSLADIIEAIGEDAAKKIADCCNTKVFMRCNDVGTAEYVSKYSQRVKRYSPILVLGGKIMIREMDENSVLTEHVLNLQPRDFLLFSFDGAFKGRTRILPPPQIEIQMPDCMIRSNGAI